MSIDIKVIITDIEEAKTNENEKRYTFENAKNETRKVELKAVEKLVDFGKLELLQINQRGLKNYHRIENKIVIEDSYN